MSHILILDIGKTNKKCFVFDEDYRILFQKTIQLAETIDEDGEPCEDLELLKNWVIASVREVLHDVRFQIRAIHCTTYGASFVHLDTWGQPLKPLYNYLKFYPQELQKQFFDTYGPEVKIARETASPVLGSLNSGLQLYRLKYHNPSVFKQIKWSLHLPQYVSTVISVEAGANTPGDLESPGEFAPASTDITSIGCHTMLWDFRKNDYHDWVKAEGITEKFPPLPRSGGDFESAPDFPKITLGHGLHDSSAALIPYLACFEAPFVLISTGTWCISLNPFNQEPLTSEELAQDCLCYLSYEGRPVKAARYFGGHAHEEAVKKMAREFGVAEDFYRQVQIPEALESRYLTFMRQLIEKQVASTRLAIGHSPILRLYVDGGFSQNETYMRLLAEAFPKMEVFAAEVSQATALGAALAIHSGWNKKPLSKHLILFKQIFV
jgi:sugar (pentulose or hexulose) kinase